MAVDPEAVLTSKPVIEALAAVEHERWADWQRYLHDQCDPLPDGSLIIRGELVARWRSQLERSYLELSEKEKESDRKQVRRYLPILIDALIDANKHE